MTDLEGNSKTYFDLVTGNPRLKLKRRVQNLRIVGKYLKRTRSTPKIFLMGFQKCGTTTMYNNLLSTGKVIGAKRKEIDVLAEKNGSLSQLLYYFPKKKRGIESVNASHQTLFVPEGYKNFKKYFKPGDVKIVLMARDPVKRALSHFRYDKQLGLIKSDVDINKFLLRDLKIAKSVTDYSNREEIFKKSCYYSQYGSPIFRGIYYPYVAQLLNDGYQVKLLFLEEYQKNPKLKFEEVLDFLDLTDVDTDFLSNDRIFNRGTVIEEFSSEVEEEIREFFQPFNEQLFELTGKQSYF